MKTREPDEKKNKYVDNNIHKTMICIVTINIYIVKWEIKDYFKDLHGRLSLKRTNVFYCSTIIVLNILINRKLLEMLKEIFYEYKIEKRLKNYFLLYSYQRVQMIRIAPIL